MPGIELPDKEFNQLSRNDRFLKKLDQAIQTNMANEQFGVEQLAEAMSLSRAQLYRTLHGITRKNVSQYLREYRLRKAMKMLEKDVASASEIAYLVGFSSPSYFNKCFHDFYGITPGAVPHKDSEEDSDKIKPIYGENLDEDEQSIRFNRFTDLSQEKKHNTNIVIETQKRTTQIFSKRTMNTVVFTGIIIVAVFLLWKYIPGLLAPEELKTGVKPIVAVLPFRNDSPDPDNDYFCNQISEEIRLQLQKINNLIVKQTIEEEKYDYKEKSQIALGSELSVSHILDGSVRKAGNNLRVTVFLFDAETGEQIWADSYDGVYSNAIFDFQSNVAMQVCNSLNAVLSRDEENRLYARYTDSLRSYDLTIMGEYEMAKILNSNSNDLDPALELFDEALEIDPENVKALVDKGRAITYLIMPENDMQKDSVRYYCDKAIEIDPEYPEAYFLKGKSYNQPSTQDLAIGNFMKTIEFSPNHAGAHSELGTIYVAMKLEYPRGLYYLSKALEMNVYDDPNVNGRIAGCLMHSGFYNKSKEYYMKTIASKDLVPNNTRFWSINNYAWILIVEQMHEEAYVFLDTMKNYLPEYPGVYRMWQLTHSINNRDFARAELYLDTLTVAGVPPFMRSGVAWFYQQTGREEEANAVIEEGLEIFQPEKGGENWWAGNFHRSCFLALKGDKEEATEYFARSIDANGGQWGWPDMIETNPIFENLRDEPEFKRQVQRSKNKQAALHKQILEMQERGEINL